MKLTIASTVLLFFISFGAVSQETIHDYHYAKVPNQFEFLKGKDQYQVNSLTVFLLNKYGFNAYLTDDLPLYLQKLPCKGLTVEIEASESFLTTKTVVVFKDCYGTILYTSQEGKSKEKEYKKAYQAAVRMAFESVAELNINQLELSEEDAKRVEQTVVTQEEKTEETAVALTTVQQDVDAALNTEDESQDATATSSTKVVLPEAWFLSEFAYKDYSLKKQGKGYAVFYKDQVIGTAIQSNDEIGSFNVVTTQFKGTGTLNSEGFIINRQIEGMDQVISMPFTAKQ